MALQYCHGTNKEEAKGAPVAPRPVVEVRAALAGATAGVQAVLHPVLGAGRGRLAAHPLSERLHPRRELLHVLVDGAVPLQPWHGGCANIREGLRGRASHYKGGCRITRA